MSAAAENRFAAKNEREARDAVRPGEGIDERGAGWVRQRVNSLPSGTTRLFCDTVARPLPEGGWGLMNRQAGGYASYCIPFPSLDAIRRKFAIGLGAVGRDEHGLYWEILAL